MFFFGFLSSILPYAATLVLMGLYFLIGTPKTQEEQLQHQGLEISVNKGEQTPSVSHYNYTDEIQHFQASSSTSARETLFLYKEKLKSHSRYIKHYEYSITSALKNKAPPVLA